ncbi:hypothetical protein Fmac_021218 [Flemingia macrophylla]|uniref:Protein kinase domain-containing protein n=1 Tax=Flemingia macrophylla TaxID=520843 RepID=A0ABD1LW76_9FABA
MALKIISEEFKKSFHHIRSSIQAMAAFYTHESEMFSHFLSFVVLFFPYDTGTSTSLDTLAASRSLHDGETLVSASGIIECGWLTEINLFGIPKDSSISMKKELELLNDRNITIWSSNISSKGVRNPVAHPLDSGNFVVRNGTQAKDDGFLWQSFDYPVQMVTEQLVNAWQVMFLSHPINGIWQSAYANLDIRDGGSDCLLWFNTLTDMRKFPWGQNFYTRVPGSELGHVGHGNIRKKTVEIGVGVIILGLVTCACIFVIKNHGTTKKLYDKCYKTRQRKEDADLPTFDLSVLANATENFSNKNKLGEGGFGPVYKGKLTDGQEIAVKRLSKKSRQGLREFKNEVSLIVKLQHRETKTKLLDWRKRFNIISGIARGILYLHQDSRLRIIHRDLKTSNILLDANLNPKISDFGLAQSFFGDQVEANTNRIAGTYGYMPPEYITRGHFSVKSDVFSYGVIVLEIAWTLWTEKRALELLDEVLGDQFVLSEVIRCIQVGLLCVQQRPEDRPDMSLVVLMLNGDKLLSNPKVPGFCTEIDVISEENSSSNHKLNSVNELSITELDAR